MTTPRVKIYDELLTKEQKKARALIIEKLGGENPLRTLRYEGRHYENKEK